MDSFFRNVASGSTTILFKLSPILLSQIRCTLEETSTVMSKEDLFYLHNIPEAYKMELFSKATFYTYREAYLFSLVFVASWDNVLAMGNPSKERNTWMGKCEVMEHKHSKFLEETSTI